MLTKEEFDFIWLKCFPLTGEKDMNTFREELLHEINKKLIKKEWNGTN